MPYYVSLSDAEYRVQKILNDRYEKISIFIKHFPELKTVKFKKPEIRWRSMGRQVAGCCYLQYHIIEMNTNYLSSKDWKKFIDDTIIHELGHSIAFDLFRDEGHGPNWRLVTKFMGDNGERCHNYSKPTINHVERKTF